MKLRSEREQTAHLQLATLCPGRYGPRVESLNWAEPVFVASRGCLEPGEESVMQPYSNVSQTQRQAWVQASPSGSTSAPALRAEVHHDSARYYSRDARKQLRPSPQRQRLARIIDTRLCADPKSRGQSADARSRQELARLKRPGRPQQGRNRQTTTSCQACYHCQNSA